MAFGNFMNMEKLSLTIAENHIARMTDGTYDADDCSLDMERLTGNIENGFVAITQLSCYFESFLNTIVSTCMHYDGEALLKCSVEEKLDLIFMHYQRDWKSLKGQAPWEIYRKATRVRNEMIHYKKTYIGEGTGIPDFKLGGQGAAEFFTQKSMKAVYEGHIKLAESIAAMLGLRILAEIGIFACDGRDGLVNYVYDPGETAVDQSRFE